MLTIVVREDFVVIIVTIQDEQTAVLCKVGCEPTLVVNSAILCVTMPLCSKAAALATGRRKTKGRKVQGLTLGN